MSRRLTKFLLMVCVLPVLQPSTPSRPAPWNRPPEIGLAAADNDSRIPLIYESVSYWNAVLHEIGISFQLGEIHLRAVPAITATLNEMSAGKLADRQPLPYPSFMNDMDTDLLIILTDADIVSFTEHWEEKGKAIIVIKSDKTPPLSLPNVTRNVIAHELGHVIGLEHNNDVTKLMCGRPAVCRPDVFSSSLAHFLPLTEREKALLRRMYGAEREMP